LWTPRRVAQTSPSARMIGIGPMFQPMTGDRLPRGRLDAQPVNLAFDTLALRTLCECQWKAERVLGLRVAARLRDRLAEIRSFDAVSKLVAGHPREIEGGRHPYYAVDLADGYRLVLCANHNRTPFLEENRVDWSRVTRVKVLRIEVDHG
jgi:hypothetical protein